MPSIKHTYILLILALIIFGCKQTKYVPEGKYFLKRNTVIVKGGNLDDYEVESIIRQQENKKQLFIKWKLMAYNAVDSAKVAEKRKEKNKDLRDKNRTRLARQDKINARREEKARKKGDEFYVKKTVSLRDTVEPRMFLSEWYKYKVGEPPVVFDSIPFNKTISQMNAYLKSKGYYYGKVQGIVEFGKKDKVEVKYLLSTGPRYYIDSVDFNTSNEDILVSYKKFKSLRADAPLVDEPFDADILDDFRFELAKFFKNEAFYGFNPSSVSYVADTTAGKMKVNLVINVADRAIPKKDNPDEFDYEKYEKTAVSNVYFHIADTTLYEGNYEQKLEELNLRKYQKQFLTTLDTMLFITYDKKTGAVDTSRLAYITYNGNTFVRPKVLESMNYLEKGGMYSEKAVEKSYRTLLRTNLFRMIKTDLVEDRKNNKLDVHYYVVPSKRQGFGFQPRATNANGYLGVSANVNYSNNNLFRGGERLQFAVAGGFESAPPVFEINDKGEEVKAAERSFNIFEIGPSLKLEIPKLFPFDTRQISKKIRPYTVISVAYNFQQRKDFKRGSFQMNYLWRFASSKTHVFQAGFPLASVVKIINIDRKPDFEAKLYALNDLFLINAYSNQFVWQDWKFTYEYSNKDKENRRGNSLVYVRSSLDPAGNMLSLFRQFQDTTKTGQKAVFGLGYSQFIRVDNEVVYSKPLGKERSVHLRFIAGAGIPYGNTKTSLPYDYSFYAGGANDNRGWKARSLGPGAYMYYLDTNRTATQLGDIRLGGFSEFRFAITSMIKGAFFVDAGNVWTAFYDENREGSQFRYDTWFKEISLSTGVGLRLDLEYFIIRMDVGMPLSNPGLPPGERWIFKRIDPNQTVRRPKFEEQAKLAFGDNFSKYIPNLFPASFHFGIGYPF